MPFPGHIATKRVRSTKTRAKTLGTDYSLLSQSLDFVSLGAGADLNTSLFDNSARVSNVPVRVVKLKSQYAWDADVVDERLLLMSVHRETQDATPLSLDTESAVKNATQDGRFYRRPSLTHTNPTGFGVAGHMDHFLKPTILKNVLLDNDDDIVLAFTNVDAAFTAAAQNMFIRMEAWFCRL